MMSVSLAVEQLHHNSRLQQHGDDIVVFMNDTPSRIAPRRTRSNKSERAKQIRRQLEDSAMAQLQMSIEAQGASAAAKEAAAAAVVVTPHRRHSSSKIEKPMDREKKSKSRRRSKSPTKKEKHTEKSKSRSPTNTRQAFSVDYPDPHSSTRCSIQPPKRTSSQTTALSKMQRSLEPSSADMTRPPRSPSKLSSKLCRNEAMLTPNATKLPIGDLPLTSDSSIGNSSLNNSVSITEALAPPPFERGQSSETATTTTQDRLARKERREERRERKSRSASQKRSKSKSTTSLPNGHHQLTRLIGKGPMSSSSSVDMNTMTSSSVMSSSQSKDQNCRDRIASYPSPKEEQPTKGDSPPAPPRKAPRSPPNVEQQRERERAQSLPDFPGIDRTPTHPEHNNSSRSSFSSPNPGSRWESDTMLPAEPPSGAVASDDHPTRHPGIVVSTSTRRRNRPSRSSSINSNATEATQLMSNLPARHLSKTRSRRVQRCASESTMNSHDVSASPTMNSLPAAASSTTSAVHAPTATGNCPITLPPTSPNHSREIYTPPLSPFSRTQQPPRRSVSAELRPPLVASPSKTEKQQMQKQIKTPQQRGSRFISGIRKSFSFSGGKKTNGASSKSSDGTIKGKDIRKTEWDSPAPALSKFLKTPTMHHPPPSPANTERTGHTVSTASTEQSDMSQLSSFNDSPAPRREMIRMVDSGDSGVPISNSKHTKSRSGLFNLPRLKDELDKPRGSGSGGLDDGSIDDGSLQQSSVSLGRIIDPHILVQAASAVVDPDSMLAAHFQKAKRRAESKGQIVKQDIDEASDIVSTTQRDINSRSLPSRSKSSSSTSGRSKRSTATKKDKKHHKKTVKHSVIFDRVTIREYDRCVGDNPAVSSGPPIGLGWSYTAKECSVDMYESSVRAPPPRTRKDFFLTPQKRFHILLDQWGFSVQEICRAKDEASEIRYQRQVSVFGGNPDLQSQVTKKAAVAAAAAAAAVGKKKTKKIRPTKNNSNCSQDPNVLSQSVQQRSMLLPPVSPVSPRSNISSNQDQWMSSSSCQSSPYPPSPLDIPA